LISVWQATLFALCRPAHSEPLATSVSILDLAWDAP